MEKLNQRELFIWKKEHDSFFVSELLLVEPYVHKEQSKERGQAWKKLTENLNRVETPKFRVSVRSVRDRFKKLMDQFKKNENEEARASGIIGEEYDEIYQGLNDIHDRMLEAQLLWEQASSAEKEKVEKEKRKAEDMRRKATETLGETEKRHREDTSSEEIPKKKRNSNKEFVSLVEEGLQLRRVRDETDRIRREEDLEERRLARANLGQIVESQQNFMANMQAQQQQFMLQLQQQNLKALESITKFLKS